MPFLSYSSFYKGVGLVYKDMMPPINLSYSQFLNDAITLVVLMGIIENPFNSLLDFKIEMQSALMQERYLNTHCCLGQLVSV